MNKIFIICLIIGCLIITSGCTTRTSINQTNNTSLPTPTPIPPVLTIKYFTTTNCPLCQETDLLLVNLSKKYPNRMKITELGLTDSGNRNIYAMYTVNLKDKTIPLIVINEKILLVNYSEIVTHLEPILKGEEVI
jgi:hypothetical protein